VPGTDEIARVAEIDLREGVAAVDDRLPEEERGGAAVSIVTAASRGRG
jgi:hypothetical protein